MANLWTADKILPRRLQNCRINTYLRIGRKTSELLNFENIRKSTTYADFVVFMRFGDRFHYILRIHSWKAFFRCFEIYEMAKTEKNR